MLKPPALNYMGFDYNLRKASFKHAINSYSQIRYALLLSPVILLPWVEYYTKSYGAFIYYV